MTALLHFRCLGATALLDRTGANDQVIPSQPKRLALLSYLLLADPHEMQSRDALLGMFWPESTEESARASLRQALRYLRQVLGPDVVLNRGRTWVGVNCERITCDAWQVEALLEHGDERGALELYGGELLTGLEVRGCPEFDQWLVTRRRELASRLAAVAGGLAETARDEGDASSAIAFARRSTEINPASEAEVRRLMGMQLWAGDRSAALHTYERFKEQLETVFDAVPSTRTRELAERARGPAGSRTEATGAEGDMAFGSGGSGISEAPEVPPPPTGELDLRLSSGPTGRSGPSSISRSSVPEVAVVSGPARTGRGLWRPGLAVMAILAVAHVSWGLAEDSAPGGGTDQGAPNLLVFPFEASSGDSTIQGLEHTIAPVLEASFGASRRATVIARDRSLNDQPLADPAVALREARSAGARWIATGRILGGDQGVQIEATLLDSVSIAQPRMISVSGPSDSIYRLVRNLSHRILALTAGVSEDEAARLARTTSPALLAYLAGRDALMGGRFVQADISFRQALRHDSTFAQAAVGLVETHLGAPWIRGHAFKTSLPLAVRLRDGLGTADRAIITAIGGPHYPEPSTEAEYYRAWETAVRHAPDRASVWYQFGDALYHVGPYIGIANHRHRARQAFLKALQLDSSYLLPLGHLVELDIEKADFDAARDRLERLLRSDHRPDNADYLRWRLAVAARDDHALGQLRSRLDGLNVASLKGILVSAQFMGAGLDDADRIAQSRPDAWQTPAERFVLLEALRTYALNRGRPGEAATLLAVMADAGSRNRQDLRMALRAVLIAEGDPGMASAAADQVEARVRTDLNYDSRVNDLCILEAWKLSHDDSSTIQSSLLWLDKVGFEGGERRADWCATVLRGLRARDATPDVEELAAEQLRQLVEEGADPPGIRSELLRIITADLLERRGRIREAREVLRLHRSVPLALAYQLRHAARLSVLAGDTAAAVEEYRHYLRLRADPEPALVPQRDSVNAEYSELVGLVERGHPQCGSVLAQAQCHGVGGFEDPGDSDGHLRTSS